MRAVPNTLEEVQYQVLQGDLTLNPKLQPSSIPAKDKELKTVAKKVIPAINELVKLIATCKQSVDTYAGEIEEKVNAYGERLSEAIKEEQLKALEEKLASLDETVKVLVSDASEALKVDYANVMEQKMKALEGQIESIVKKQIEEAGESQGAGTGGNELKREFISSDELLQTGAKCQAPFKLQEVQDFNRQVEVLAYSSKYDSYIRVDAQYKLDSSSTSIYEAYTKPITVKVAEDGTLTLVSADSRKLKVYFYNLV